MVDPGTTDRRTLLDDAVVDAALAGLRGAEADPLVGTEHAFGQHGLHQLTCGTALLAQGDLAGAPRRAHGLLGWLDAGGTPEPGYRQTLEADDAS